MASLDGLRGLAAVVVLVHHTMLLVPALLRACWSSSTSVRALMGIGGVLAIFLAINGPALIFSDPGPDLLFILGATAGTLILAGFALRRYEAR